MKSKILPIVFAFVTLLATNNASAYYNPQTGRWLSRDPMGEPGFEFLRAANAVPRVGQVASTASLPPSRWINRDPIAEKRGANRYAFVANNPISTIDLLGLDSPSTVSVGICEIVVAYGHGIDGSPHHFDFGGPCSAGWFVGCYSSQTDGGLNKYNGISGAVSISGEYDFATDPAQFGKDFQTSWDAAIAKAHQKCSYCKCLCPSITVKAVKVSIHNWTKDWLVPSESRADVPVSCSK
jgi:hypothetical protein